VQGSSWGQNYEYYFIKLELKSYICKNFLK